ncbi:amidase [Actinocorallia herbida]|uniref:Amidase n=1 Tax=Actinocorallia herbida TaxID=58109 RepID=A0A3N1D7K5_9ACTN|nr:amidase [Actinocorallia herbida]
MHHLTARRQAAAVRSGEISPVELTAHYLERVDRLDHRVGAFVTHCPETALDQARKAERIVAEAVAPPVLLGLPVPVKDLHVAAGLPTGYGSLARGEPRSPVDGPVAALLRAAGAVVLGKTGSPEFGLTCYTDFTHFAQAADLAEGVVPPTVRNPWAPDRLAGGSSGGAAAAVAAGLAPLAHGSDGGGSIRIPASACGLVGIKPSRRVVPVGADPFGLAVSGPIARDVRDAALLLDALSGRAGTPFLDAAERPPGPLRIARTALPADPGTVIHPECLAAYETASRLLAGLGHEIVELPPVRTPALARLFETAWTVLAAAERVPADRERLLQPLTRWLRERGGRVGPAALAELRTALAAEADRALAVMAPYDAVLTPALAEPPAPVGHFTSGSPEEDFARQNAHTPFAALANITGQPSLTLPLHWTRDGLPVGVMLSGRPGGDAALIALAARLEAAAPAGPPFPFG